MVYKWIFGLIFFKIYNCFTCQNSIKDDADDAAAAVPLEMANVVGVFYVLCGGSIFAFIFAFTVVLFDTLKISREEKVRFFKKRKNSSDEISIAQKVLHFCYCVESTGIMKNLYMVWLNLPSLILCTFDRPLSIPIPIPITKFKYSNKFFYFLNKCHFDTFIRVACVVFFYPSQFIYPQISFKPVIFPFQKKNHQKAETNDADPLLIENVNGVFIVLFVGCGCAIFAGYVEFVLICFRNANKFKVYLHQPIFIYNMYYIII